MKKEQKEQIVKAAEKRSLKYDDVTLDQEPKVMVAPDTFWVQAWVAVPSPLLVTK